MKKLAGFIQTLAYPGIIIVGYYCLISEFTTAYWMLMAIYAINVAAMVLNLLADGQWADARSFDKNMTYAVLAALLVGLALFWYSTELRVQMSFFALVISIFVASLFNARHNPENPD